MSISFEVSLDMGGKKGEPPKDWGKVFEELDAATRKQAEVVHRKSVFQILRQVIFYCPVDTGRLRASWTPIMDKYGAQAIYEPVMQMRAPGQTGKDEKKVSSRAIARGKSEGLFVDQPFVTIIGTNVDYAVYVEQKVGFLARARVIGESLYARNFAAFFESIDKAKGAVPPQKYEGQP